MPVPFPLRSSRRGPRGVLLPGLLALMVGLGSCVEEIDVADSELPVLVSLELVPSRVPELEVTARDLVLDLLRMDLRDADTGEEVATGDVRLDGDSVPGRIRIRKDVPEGWEAVVEGTVELIRLEEVDGGEPVEVVEWAVVLQPALFTADDGVWEVELPLGRGNLAELAVEGVSLAAPEAPLVEGDELVLEAAPVGGPEGTRLFWGAEDPGVASVDGSGRVTALLPGQTRIIAAAGYEWAAAEVEVLQGISEIVVEPSSADLVELGQLAEFSARVLDPRGEEVLDRPLTILWSAADLEVAEHVGDGVFQAVGPGTTQITARVEGIEGVEGTATLTVSAEVVTGGELIRWTSVEGSLWSEPGNWDLGRIPQEADTVEIALEGSNVTVSVDVAPPPLSELRLGPQTGGATLVLADGTLAVEGLFVIRASGELQVTGSAFLSVLDLDNSGRVSLGGALATSVAGPGGSVINRFGGTIDAQAGGVAHFTLAGAIFTNAGALALGETEEGAIQFTDGTVHLTESGSLGGSGTFGVLNGVLSTDLNLISSPWTLFLSEVELNGPGAVTLSQGTVQTWIDVTANTVVQNGSDLTLVGVNLMNAGLSNDPLGTISVVGLNDRPQASLIVIEADGFYNHGTIELIDPFEGEGRLLTLEVPEGPLVNQEGGTLSALQSPTSTVARVVGRFENLGLVRVENDVTVSFPDAAFQNLGRIELVGGATLGFQGASFANGAVGVQSAAEIVGEGVLDVSAVQFTNSALLAPGFSPGIIVVAGGYQQTSAGVLRIQLEGSEAGTGYDQVPVQGSVLLDGTLTVVLEGFTPEFGDQFTVLSWQGREGEFSGMLLPGLLEGLRWDVAYLDNALALSVTAEQQPSQVAVGGFHSCAIDGMGAAHCWGGITPGGGILGDGMVTPRSEAVPVVGGLTFRQLVPSVVGTCGLTTTGAAYCWGWNMSGELGNEIIGGNQLEPTPVVGGLEFSWLSGLHQHVCGLLASDGSARCWGRNDFQQLGDGTTENTGTPVAVGGGLSFREFTTGVNHTCALTEDGLAWCWGSNGSGELGDGTTTQRGAPTAVAGGERFHTIAAGNNATCAVDFGGTAHCWGSGFGLEPAPVGGSPRFRSLSHGSDFRCGTDFSGNAYCWGSNGSGQLGDGTTSPRPGPTAVSGGLLFTEVRASAEDRAHACGMTASRDVYCWGSDSFGQLGSGRLLWSGEPVQVAGGRLFSSVTVGTGHTCGLDGGGAAWCWGTGGSGQLGDGTNLLRTAPVAVTGGHTFSAIEAGGANHTCGIADGTVYCWGLNNGGQIGDGSTTNRFDPTPVDSQVSFQSVAVGSNHTCAISTTGSLYCWGFNGTGQLGDGTTERRLTPTLINEQLVFTRLGAGIRHTCGVVDSGDAYCWGTNDSGQLGDGTFVAQLFPTLVSGGLNYQDLVVAGHHNCAVTVDGLAACWGSNEWGQLGDNSTSPRGVPTGVASQNLFRSVSAGTSHSCGITTDGATYCWGLNSSGQVGDGTLDQRLIPTRVAGTNQFTSIASGSSFTLGLNSDGSGFGWGWNGTYQFGLGEIVPIISTVPIQALFP